MVANLAAANCFTIDHIREPENAEVIDNAKYFYISVSKTEYPQF